MMHGARPIGYDKRDYSFNKTFQAYGAVASDEVNLDAGLWMPNQNLADPVLGTPPMPYGCTNYTTNGVCSDEDKKLYKPAYTESLTHANANGGGDIRQSLLTAVNKGVQAKDETTDIEAATHKRPALFRVGQNPDYFGGAKVVLSMGRPISAGGPWFEEWGMLPTATGKEGIAYEGIEYDPAKTYGWHNFEINGCTKFNSAGKLIRNGEVFLKIKSWEGKERGDGGFSYWSQTLVNKYFQIKGAGMFTVAKPEGPIKTVGMDYVFLHNLGFQMNAPEVADLQKALQSLGYTIIHAVTTLYGVETKAALAKFQQDHGIVDDGSHFGPQTRLAMNRILNPSQTLFGDWMLVARTYLGI